MAHPNGVPHLVVSSGGCTPSHALEDVAEVEVFMAARALVRGFDDRPVRVIGVPRLLKCTEIAEC